MTTQHKVWFVTGASSGFGRAIAEEIVRRGDRVVATARDITSLADLVARAPERVHLAPLDVTKGETHDTAIASAVARFGAIDVLVNNAGYGIVGAVEETSDEELRAAMETMFFGAARLTRALVGHMRQRSGGTIVQVTSMGGVTTGPGFGAYCAAKHALEGFSECLAAEVKPFGVRVLIVEPGAFRTRLFGAGFRTMPAMDAYAETVGGTRKFTADVHGAQAGDPAKAAKAIANAVDAGTTALRLPLGADAIDGIRAKVAGVLRDVDSAESVAGGTAYQAD
jgi:NAD(P)-dependent dehydrogenase (short-subunit alcohol dehydrogenase family)